MPATQYKVWRWDAPVGNGIMGAVHVGVWGIAKAACPDFPFVVANELICYNLAKAILLPIPPGFIVTQNGTLNYASLNFNLSGVTLPPADSLSVVSEVPDIAAGIVVFDMWVVNQDRHEGNLAYDMSKKKVEIFDHSHAFFHGPDAHTARNDLMSAEECIGIKDHCLANELIDLLCMKKWVDRIKAIPTFYIKEVIQAATEVGLPGSEAEFCEDFLCQRRDVLEDLIRTNKEVFPKVQPTLWYGF